MASTDFLNHIDRRTFLRLAAFTGISHFIYPKNIIAGLFQDPLSRVVSVHDSTATDGLAINSVTVESMIQSGIRALAGQDVTGESWKTLLPGIMPESTVAIKVNCINSALPTHPEVTLAVAESLQEMTFDSTPFSANNIIIFDRTSNELQRCGYVLNSTESGVRCYGTNSSGVGYSSEYYDIGGINQRISKIITEQCDYLINISVLKNHGTAGVTLCLKNHYGTCHDPDSIHGGHASPYIGSLNAQVPIVNKQMINICDALFGIKTGGPGGSPQFTENKILMSKDIVAVDYNGREILEENGSTTIGRTEHIESAAETYNLGTNDPAKMEIVNIENPSTAIDHPFEQSAIADGFVLEQNYPNPFNNQTRIRFYVNSPEFYTLSIFDDSGRLIKTLLNRTMTSGWHSLNWDGKNSGGNLVASGMYVLNMQSRLHRKAIIMHLIK